MDDVEELEKAIRPRGSLCATCPECRQSVIVKTVVGAAPVLYAHPNYGRTALQDVWCAGSGREVASL